MKLRTLELYIDELITNSIFEPYDSTLITKSESQREIRKKLSDVLSLIKSASYSKDELEELK